MTYTIQQLRDLDLIIFETVSGSRAYGTHTPDSDTDIRGVFIQPLDDIIKYGYVEQVSDKKNDITFYELFRFMNLLMANNPNIIELLAMPEECIIHRHPLYKILEDSLDKILTKKVKLTFAGYAISQIKKARGYDKKMNWEKNKTVRKSVLDFCYVLVNEGTEKFNTWLSRNADIEKSVLNTQKDYGLSKINNAHNLYALYFLGENGHGIVSGPDANDVQLSSIPKGTKIVGHLYFNNEGYSSHCKKYKEYQEWLKNRNPNRVKMNSDHGKNYDSKNMNHTYRLLLMSKELAGGVLKVKRSPEDIKLLMKIRRGEYEYDDLIKDAEKMISELDELYENSNLPTKPDETYIREQILHIRKSYNK